jgi:hypothetical protein
MIPEHLVKLLRKHRSQGVILDSNLLVLAIVGLLDPCLIATERPTRNQGFTTTDFDFLVAMLRAGGKLCATPHILAETSNLLDQCKYADRTALMGCFAESIRGVVEIWTPAPELLEVEVFPVLGLTDSAVFDLSRLRHLAITVDSPLFVELQRRQRPVINFNHYRPSLSRAVRAIQGR